MKRKDILAIPPQSLEECETDAQKIEWLLRRNDQLEKECKAYREDGLYAMYYAENRKSGELAASLNSFVLSLTGDDKVFERYMNLKKIQPLILKTLDALRRDYLKQDEATLAEIEKNGVPLIERRAVKK